MPLARGAEGTGWAEEEAPVIGVDGSARRAMGVLRHSLTCTGPEKMTLGLEGLDLGLLDPHGRGALSFERHGRRTGCAMASGQVYPAAGLFIHYVPIVQVDSSYLGNTICISFTGRHGTYSGAPTAEETA